MRSPSLDYVSPLPPVRSGIADYSADLLPHLAQRVDLRVVRLPDLPVSDAMVRRWLPVEASALGRDDRVPLYQMGNNPYHAGVRKLALEYPGVLTLHDIVLHHLLAGETLGAGVFEPYLEALEEDHGWIGRAVGQPRFWGGYSDAGIFALPAHRGLLRRQRGVLVHSRWAAELLREEDPDLAVRAVPMGVPLPPAVDAAEGRAYRDRWGIPRSAPLLGSFGFQTPIKRTLSALHALVAPELRHVHLLIVGEVSPELDYETEIQRLGVAERVTVTGFVDFDEFQAAIAAVDLCINLRYPTAGETSASLLRVLAMGRGAVVSDYAQFAELPAAVAARVPLGGREHEALVAALVELLEDPGRTVAMGRAARDHVRREHAPEKAADAIAEACRELAEAAPLGAAGATLPVPTSIAWGEMAGSLEVDGTGHDWHEGERRRLRLRLRNGGACRWLAARRGAGGVALEVRLETARGDLMAGVPWLPLPRDLDRGEEVELEVPVRRPPGRCRLVIEPRVVGGASFGDLGGPTWERDL
ncbi:MAG: glycosyltransferase family 4 protein [Acidobacteriota bacterium]